MGPRLFFGTRAGAALLEAGVGLDDNGEVFSVRARTNRVAPLGSTGECIFTRLFFTVVHHSPVSFQLTPIIDGRAYATQEVTLDGTAPPDGPFTEDTRLVDEVEIGLSEPYLVGGVERLRQSPRGTWIEVQLTADDETYLRVDHMEVEYARVRARARPQGVPV